MARSSDLLTYDASQCLTSSKLTHQHQSVYENRIYSVKMHCGETYPRDRPTIHFVTQINLPCVDPHTGLVDQAKLPVLAQWDEKYTMEMILIELRRFVHSFLGFCYKNSLQSITWLREY